ncbi:ABC-2 transporter permease [Raoultibacter phocaeensis]|uniref:ABC-2 transporter permease n=1 Tax=Raoultibacter phocaeensis TaxID=2479841 RepID=UPI001118A813|nr:ABC-2 transporter permease [Raoultibacter phocaeensis]
MKAMILSDLLTVKKYMRQQALLYTVIVIALSVFMGNLYMIVPFLGVMMPFSLAFTLLAYDERNNWEQFRLALPLSRKNVIAGRYASLAIVLLFGIVLGLAACLVVIGISTLVPGIPERFGLSANFSAQEIILSTVAPIGMIAVMLSITLPLIARFGMTKAVRYVPVFFLVIILFVVGSGQIFTFDFTAVMPFLSTVASMMETIPGTLAIAGVVIAVGTVIYALSCVLSMKLYAKREF